MSQYPWRSCHSTLIYNHPTWAGTCARHGAGVTCEANIATTGSLEERKVHNKDPGPYAGLEHKGHPWWTGTLLAQLYLQLLPYLPLGPVPSPARSPSPGFPCPCYPGLPSVWLTARALSWFSLHMLCELPLLRACSPAHTPPKVEELLLEPTSVHLCCMLCFLLGCYDKPRLDLNPALSPLS